MSCVTCSRIFVFILALAMLIPVYIAIFLFQLVSLTVIALSLWIRLDNGFEEQIRKDLEIKTDAEPLSHTKNDMRTWITVSFWVIIAFSIACALMGLVGLLGAAAKSRALLVLFFVAMIIVILLEIAVGIYVIVQRDKVRDCVYEYVNFSYEQNSPVIKEIQFRYKCCGTESRPYAGGCFQGSTLPYCSAAVWDRLDFTLMVFGWSMLGVVILQILLGVLTIPVFVHRRDRVSSGSSWEY